ncbi:ankyrin repeat-containing domain protein [Podospora aff. communis PSN243]|uniref:Ankyrin repeat-containing domain protein n=1 Tax=Podospora aff. communis PSN243 TaxID=3040156 RepID=A0AAV9G3H5_9PEZI|nr:ankyrin repeat-containing domain protein [Podospora aff. communis PSN243]
MEAVASVIAVLQLSETVLTRCYRYAGKVKDAAADIDRIIHQIGPLSALLQDLHDLSKSGGTRAANSIKNLSRDHGPLSVCAQCLEELTAKLPSGPVTFRQKLQWPLESRKISEITEKIAAQMPLLEVAISSDTFCEAEAAHRLLDEAKHREHRDKVLNWLRCADPTVKHLATRKLHQPGSNQWVFENSDFVEWKEKPGHVLWLHGIPGAGKTVICSTIIDHIEQLCRSKNHDARLAYYYFDFSNQETQNINTLLRCLIWQLCETEQAIPPALLADVFFHVLHGRNRRLQRYIIIDALDECPIDKRSQIFDLVLNRIERGGEDRNYNFLVTSRKESDITEQMAEAPAGIHEISIPADCVNADVRLHVSRFIENHRDMKSFPPHLKEEILDTLSSKTEGMFRWAVCQLEFIKDCKQVGRVRSRLKDLPETLDETYDRILASIPEDTWQIAKTAFVLLAHSMRPLTIQEVAEGMVIDPEGHRFEPEEQRLTNYRQVLEICSSLVSVTKGVHDCPRWLLEMRSLGGISSQAVNDMPEDLEIVRLARFSVQEYMTLRRNKQQPRICRYLCTDTDGHAIITKLSLVYLLDFSRGLRLASFDFGEFPFLAYAARYWPEHWRLQLSATDQKAVDALVRRLFDTDPSTCFNYINYLNICPRDSFLADDPDTSDPGQSTSLAKCLDSLPQPLYYSAELGHMQLFSGQFGQAIQIAARFGHKDVVAMLLNRGADTNRRCGRYGYVLQAAAFGGHIEVVKLLLDTNANIDAVGGRYWTALNAACHQQHLDTAAMLLDHGADVDLPWCMNFGGKYVRTKDALSTAVSTRNGTMVNLLLSRGANVNATCCGDETPLHTAARILDIKMVKLLVNAGADVNALSTRALGGTVLQNACSKVPRYRKLNGESNLNAYIDIARFLINNGADHNLRGRWLGSTLKAAVVGSWGHGHYQPENCNFDIVRLIIEHGGDLYQQGGFYGSALRAAVELRNIQAIHLFLDLGLQATDGLFLGAVRGPRPCERLALMLLEKGVDVNSEDDTGTALCLALEGQTLSTAMTPTCRNTGAVKRLLALGADPNQPSKGVICLSAAIRAQNIEIVTLLLNGGADVNANVPKCPSPLMTACDLGDEALLEFLISRGADVNLWVPWEGDALQAAAFGGNKNIVRRLLSLGANPKAPGGKYGSCLESAMLCEDLTIFHILLEAGALVTTWEVAPSMEDGTDWFSYRRSYGSPHLTSLSCKQGHLARLLLERGADPHWCDPQNGTALNPAIWNRDEDMVRLILARGVDVNRVSSHGERSLICAINAHRQGDKIVELLLEHGADVNLQGEEKLETPLFTAIERSKYDLVRLLLDYGARLHASSNNYSSALHCAVSREDLDVFRLLLQRGADPNIISPEVECKELGLTSHLRTALCCAVKNSQHTMLKELLSWGADPKLGESIGVVTAAESNNMAALELLIEHGANSAARQNNADMVEFFISRGVDVNASNARYGSALMAVFENSCSIIHGQSVVIADMLLDAGAEVNSGPSLAGTSPLQLAISNLHRASVYKLLDQGADVNAHDPRHPTALAAAVVLGDVDLMKRLVALGADLALCSDMQAAPLQPAASVHDVAATEYLFSLGADVNQLSGAAGYGLHAVCEHESTNSPVIIQMLLDHGADPNARGGIFGTALNAAAENGCLENLKLLLKAGADPTIEAGKYGTPIRAAMDGNDKHYLIENYLRRHFAKMKTAS